ncbi:MULTISPECIES: conjugal transfer entry exclusion protein TraS [Aeromonas]|uniref:conjugal transfer entry exclusion protein TraS n=1 Tax=Aeromonas TaxID=642 RepID=UPI003F40E600
MNISNKTIKNDVAFIIASIKNEDATIPSFTSCAIPGLTFMIGLTLWQFFVAYPVVHFDKMTKLAAPASVAFSFVLGAFVFLAMTSLRGKYLSLPLEVREKSIIIKIITQRSLFYACTWVAINILAGAFIKQHDIPVMFSYGAQLVSLVAIYLIAIVDLGRYDLALLSSAIQQWREGVDVDASLHKP